MKQLRTRGRYSSFRTKVKTLANELAVTYCIAFTSTVFVLIGIAYLGAYGYRAVRIFEDMTAPVTYAMVKPAPPAPQPPLVFIDVTRPPILAKIAIAESGDRQFDQRGVVVKNVNKDGSVDVGRYQINLKYHAKNAKALGYDLMTDEGNEAYAIWLLRNHGTSPWRSSEVRWSKL